MLEPGDLIQFDTQKQTPEPGITIHHFSARDTVSRWDVAGVYRRATARNGRDFLQQIVARMPIPVKAVQACGAASGAAFPRGRLPHDPPSSGVCLRHAPRPAPGPPERENGTAASWPKSVSLYPGQILPSAARPMRNAGTGPVQRIDSSGTASYGMCPSRGARCD